MKIAWASRLFTMALIANIASGQTAAPAKVAATPPMGWNSWDAY